MEENKNEIIEKEEVKYCSFSTAVKWLGTNLVLLNNVCEIDTDFFPYESIETDDEEDETYSEIFQYFITSMSDSDVEWSRKHFPDVHYAYSELLNSWILLVTHYGTSWDYVPTRFVGDLHISKDDRVYKEYIERKNKDK